MDALQAARALGTFAVLMASGDDEIRGEIARPGLLVGGFENAAYDLKYHLRGLAVQIFQRFYLFLRVVCGCFDKLKRFENKNGGSAWESNPPGTVLAPHTGFEVREPHQ